MPANLTPEYLEAEKAYREAKTSEEKLHCLEYMLSVIPKHKGTDKMQGELRRKIAKLNKEETKKSGSRKSSMFNVPKEGAGQVVLAGAPNSGKSTVLASLTNAEPEIADYPYTTAMPQPGMIPYENIKIQLVDLPGIGKDYTESWVPGIVRNADLALLVVNLASDEVLEETEYVLERLTMGKVELVEKVTQRFKPDGSAQVKARMLLTGSDHPDAPEVIELIEEVFGRNFTMWRMGRGMDDLAEKVKINIFQALEIVRVYTKGRGKKPEFQDPVVLPLGSTVTDFAFQIHKDLARNMKFAKIWGKDKYDGQKVQRDYELVDGDVIELHA